MKTETELILDRMRRQINKLGEIEIMLKALVDDLEYILSDSKKLKNNK